MTDTATISMLIYNQPRGGLPLPTAEWYENRDADGKPRPISHSDTNRRSTLYQGFNISISQYEISTKRIVELLLSNEIYKDNFGTRRFYINTWPIRGALKAEFPFITEPAVPEWWTHDALTMWIRMAADWMRKNPDKLVDGAPAKKSRIRGKGMAKSQKSAKMPLFKHCSFIITIRDTHQSTTVPLIDLIRDGGHAGDDHEGDLETKDLDRRKLANILRKELPLGRCDELVYTIALHDSKADVAITCDAHLHNAAHALRTRGIQAIPLEIIQIKSDIETRDASVDVGSGVSMEPMSPQSPNQ